MLTKDDIRRMALCLPEAVEAPHFDSTSFRVGKKIFCTLGEDGARLVVKLTPEDQDNLVADDPVHILPVEGYWGRGGWTQIAYGEMDEARVANLLRLAWSLVAPKRLLKAQG